MSNMVTIREGGQRHKSSTLMTPFVMMGNILSSRELIWQIYKRDFINANKRSFLGFAWNLIGPLVAALAWIIMNMAGVLRPGDLGVPYPVYVLIGSSLWALFLTVFTMTGQTLSSGKGFINQVSYPHEALMAKQVMHAVSIFAISFIFNLAIITLMGYPPAKWAWLVPILVIPLILLASALGLVCSILFVAGDIEKAVGTFFGLLVYTVPIYYGERTEGFLAVINQYNPLTYLFCFIRDMIIFGESSYLQPYLIVSGVSVVLFLVALRIFYVTEMLVIEKMS